MPISTSGIEQAIAGLNYRNSSAVKCRLLDVIKQYYDGLESPEMVRIIATDDLVQKIWDLEPDPSAIQSKRKNLSSIKSTINADLDRAWREGRNPEGIMIGPDNTFTMSNEAKDKMIAAFSGAVSADGTFKMDEVNAALRLVSEFLSSRKDTEMAGDLEKLTEIVKKITEETGGNGVSGYDLVKKGDNKQQDAGGSGEKTGGAGLAAAEKKHGDLATGESTGPGMGLSPEAPIPETDVLAVLEEEDVEQEALLESVDDVLDLETVALEEAISDAAEAIAAQPAPDGILDEVEDFTDADEMSEVEEVEEVEEAEDTQETEVIETVEEDEIGEILDEETEIVEEAPAALDEGEELLDEEALEWVEEIEESASVASDPGLDGLPDEVDDLTGMDALPEIEEIEEIEETEEIEVAEDDEIEEILDDAVEPVDEVLDEIEALVEEVLSDEEIEFVDEEVSNEKDELGSEIEADDSVDGVDDIVKKLLAPDPKDATSEKSSGQTDNWMQNVGLPVDMFDEDGIDLENLENDTEKKKVLAQRFDGYLGVMERYYNQFITVPEGYYVVGGKGDSEDELPFQKISLSEYYIGKFPITNAVFEIFIDRTGYVTTAEKLGYGFVYYGRFQKIVDEKTGRSRSVWNPAYTRKKVEGASWFQPLGPGSSLHNKRNHPVVQVSLKDAKSFAAWTGKRLPTEIEWEAAARTTDGRRLPWGEQWLEIVCNVESSGISDTTAVNQYPGGDNPFGISDLLGNVMEWTVDPCEPKYEIERKTIFYVAKGGGWIADSRLTLLSRVRIAADFSSNLLGFRCVVE